MTYVYERMALAVMQTAVELKRFRWIPGPYNQEETGQ